MLYDTYPCKSNEVKVEPNLFSYEIPGHDGARIAKLATPGKLLCCQYDDAQTLIEVMHRGRRISDNGPCAGWRNSKNEYSWHTYKEFMDRATHFASGLTSLGIEIDQSNGMCIYAVNSVEWIVSQYACFLQSSPVVPLYDTIGPDSRTIMINIVEAKVVVCDKPEKVKALLERGEDTPSLEYIIHMQEVSYELKKIGEKKEIQLYLFSDVEELGKTFPSSIKPPKPSDTAFILFTSGTTGDPKGVVLTHRNVIAGISGMIDIMGESKPDKNDVYLSFLPLAHIFDQAMQVLMFMHGARVGFFCGDVSLLTDDLKTLKPTIFAAVPRVLNKIYDKVDSQIKMLIGGTAKTGDASGNLTSFVEEMKSLYSPSVCRSVSDNLGGNIRLIISAAAPISERILTFYKFVLKCKILEIYGQTECAGPVYANMVTEETVGTGGAPVLCNMVKLVDVPHLDYFKENGIGEVCVKGPNVFSGYYKNQQKTAEVFDEDNWFLTGDIGQWMQNGHVKIVDRKKHVFKLSQGEYIIPERIEAAYLNSTYISQMLVHGDSLQSYLVAIVIPDENEVISWCREKTISGTWKEICSRPEVKQLILEDMKRIAKSSGLVSFQQVKDIYLHPDPLTIEGGQLTPTQKTKREIVQKMFMKNIQDMYSKSN